MTAHSLPPVPTSLHGCATEWLTLVSAFMAHSACVPARLDAATAAAPRSPALLAAKGLIFLLLGRRELADKAADLLDEAKLALVDGADAHDRMMVEALGDFVAGLPSRAAAQFDRILERYPADGFALKMAQAIRFLYGDCAGMRASAEAAIAAFADDHPHAGYAHGCRAFAAEEAGDLAAAERAGARALELAGDDAWALHAVAHVYEMQGEAKRGRDWLAGRKAVFAGCSNFAHHVWWHSALFELELGDVDAVLALYDGKIRREPTDDYRDIANAVSLLSRLEADGVAVGSRWDELAALAEARVEDGCIVFADLHYLMALLGAGRDAAAQRLVARLSEADEETEFGAVARREGARAALGLAAFAQGRHREAFEGLMEARTSLIRIGGSHAQRDVFERLTIEAALRAGRGTMARALIEERARGRGGYDRFATERLARCAAMAAAIAPAAMPAAF